MLKTWRQSGFLMRTLAAALLVVLLTVVRLLLLGSLGTEHPFLTFYPAVVIAAIFCGLPGALLATVLSMLAADYFLIEPVGKLYIRALADRVGVAVFLLEGLLISCAVEMVRRAKVAQSQAGFAEERLQAAAKVRESEERLRLALEGGQMGMWEWDVRSNRLEWSEKVYELFGFPKGEGPLTLEVSLSYLHPDDEPALQRALDTVLAQGSELDQEFRIVRPDGQVRWLAAQGRLFRDANGAPTRMLGVSYDITSHKSAREELKRSEAEARARADELAALMDTVPAMIFIAHDPECRRMTCNEKARKFLHVPAEANVSLSAPADECTKIYRTLKNGDDIAPEQLPVQIAARGTVVRNFELALHFGDGTTRDVMGDAVPLFDDAGKVRGSIGVFLDITEGKKLQLERQRETEERIQTLRSLHEKDQLLIQQGRLAAMGEMVNNIAHQWRQPLNLVGLIVQELQYMHGPRGLSKEYLDERVNKAMEIISHMSQTIDDFGNFFKPSRERHVFKASDMIERTLSLVADSFNHLEIGIELDVADAPEIYGYSNECSQVLLNLFLNSRDAFLERDHIKPRTITVKAFPEGDETVITVSDNAGGIAEEMIGKVFDPYFTTKGPDKGTGIGLFMAKNIIEKHMEGKITVRNVGDGAEFTIRVISSPGSRAPLAPASGNPSPLAH